MTVIHIGDRTNPDPKIHVLYVYLSQSPFFPYFYRKASGLADSHFICFTVRANEQLNHYCMMLWDERYRSPTEPARGRFPILKKISPSPEKSRRGVIYLRAMNYHGKAENDQTTRNRFDRPLTVRWLTGRPSSLVRLLLHVAILRDSKSAPRWISSKFSGTGDDGGNGWWRIRG